MKPLLHVMSSLLLESRLIISIALWLLIPRKETGVFLFKMWSFPALTLLGVASS